MRARRRRPDADVARLCRGQHIAGIVVYKEIIRAAAGTNGAHADVRLRAVRALKKHLPLRARRPVFDLDIAFFNMEFPTRCRRPDADIPASLLQDELRVADGEALA